MGTPMRSPERPSNLKQYVEATRGEPARLAAGNSQPSLSQPGDPLLFRRNGSNGGCSSKRS